MKSSIWTFASVCIKTIFNLIINKLVAIYLGTSGLTLLAHFQNLLGMATAIVGEGLNKGIVKYFTDSQEPTTSRYYFFWAGIICNILIFIVFLVVALFNANSLITKFTENMSFPLWLFWVSLPLVANLLNLFLLAVVQASQHFKLFALLNTLNISFSALFIYWIISTYSITKMLIAYGLGQGSSLLITLPFIYKHYPYLFHVRHIKLQQIREKIHKLADFMAIGLSIVVFSRLGVYLLREYNIATFGINNVGLWESVMRLSEGYTFAFNATFLVVFYTKVASLANPTEANKLKIYVWQTFQWLLPLIGLGLGLLYLIRDTLMILLFDESFLAATYLIGWVMIGDFFKLINYLLSNILIAKGKTWLFVGLQAIFIAQFFLIVHLLAPFWGTFALALTWFISYLLATLILIFLLRKNLFA